MKSESPLLRQVMLALTKIGTRIFRNNVGALQIIRLSDLCPVCRKRNERAPWLRYGVCNPGGSDLIGWRSLIVTPEMVGCRVAVFVAVETKAERGKLIDTQENFLDVMTAAGGIAVESRDVDETVRTISEWTPPR